jgi:predicted ATPase
MKQLFSLEALKVVNNNKTLFDVEFVDNNKNNREHLLTTVIIGTNGAGKSYLLTVTSDVFRAIENKVKNKEMNLRYSYYFCSYFFDDDYYSIEIKDKKNIKITKNQEKIGIKELELPKKILAVSYMLNDKFTFKSPDSAELDTYEYLGLRRTSNAAWTNSITRKITDSFMELSTKPDFSYKVKEILLFLKFKPKITLIFEPTKKTLFTRKMTLKQLKSKHTKLLGTDEYRSFTVRKYSDDDLAKLLDFVNSESRNRKFVEVNDRKSLIYVTDFDNENQANNLCLDSRYLRMLVDLQFINSPKLILCKDEEFDFEFASSGEKHLIFTLVNIASRIKQNSLILIDEPELSLHPNWQMKYINMLKKIFYEYTSCHFILATHSHYLISDLEQESSSIILLSMHSDNRTAELIGYSTYAWSAENILYNIFQVRTTRNFYFEMDLRNLVNMVKDKSTDTLTLVTLINKIKKYTFDKNDPLHLILLDAERYLENVEELRESH